MNLIQTSQKRQKQTQYVYFNTVPCKHKISYTLSHVMFNLDTIIIVFDC